MPTEIVQKLKQIDQDLIQLAHIVKPMIPESPSREDSVWECFNCIGGAGSATARAWRAMERAIDEL